jgi:hypothetical protein
MTDHDYEATVETDDATFTFSGDDPRTVSAQAARMPVIMHRKQIESRTDLDCPIQRYLEVIAEEQEKKREKMKRGYSRRNDRRDTTDD